MLFFFQDIMEAYDVNQSNSEEKTDNDKTDQSFDDSTNRTVDNSNHFPSQNYSGQEQKFEYVMSNEERLLIAQQMRQHIQLLTQMSLLTAKDDHWQELHTDCRGMLSQLMTRSFSQQFSVYAQDNLFPSIQVNYLLKVALRQKVEVDFPNCPK